MPRPARTRSCRPWSSSTARQAARRAECHAVRRRMAAGLAGRSAGRHASRRHGVLDVLLGLDRPAEGHRASAARHGLHASLLRPPSAAADEDDVCFSVPKIFFAYGLGNSITFPFAAGASSVLLPGQPKPAAIFEAIARYRPTVFFGLPTLYTALTKAPRPGRADLSQPAAVAFPRPRCSRPKSSTPGRRSRASRSWKAWAPPRCCTSTCPTRPGEKARRRGQARAGLRGRAAATATAARSATARKASCGCAATPTRPATGTAPTRPPRPCARAAGSTPATASCAMPTASISSAAAPTSGSPLHLSPRHLIEVGQAGAAAERTIVRGQNRRGRNRARTAMVAGPSGPGPSLVP